ncbi:MAG: 7-cyano-7-deazaguanine synthase [Vicinamibacterales bacterium]
MIGSAVLLSGGLDSAVLLALQLRDAGPVLPIHIRTGFAWEDAEARVIDELLAVAPYAGRTLAASTLRLDMRDVFPATHWAVTGEAPAYETPDEDVYIEGRNITLIAKAAVVCARLHIPRLVLGPLAGNPFPDARPEFFETMARAMSLGLDHELVIAAPLSTMHKDAVIRLGLELGVPLERTLSCMSPLGLQHCGRCSKCRERHDAFDAAHVPDPTFYVGIERQL